MQEALNNEHLWYLKIEIDPVSMHLVSSQLRMDLRVLVVLTFCSSNKTSKSILNGLDSKCMFILSIAAQCNLVQDEHGKNFSCSRGRPLPR